MFASVIEPHGYFSESQEKSRNARPLITGINVLGHNANGTVLEVVGKNDIKWQVMVNNGPDAGTKQNQVVFDGTEYAWQGNYSFTIE